jgi:hypothetical protein
MADEVSVSAMDYSNVNKLLPSSSSLLCEELQKRIEVLQHQNKVLRIEVELINC